ncbi:PUA-like domain-containing protein [Kickxella alabastrina]|uniref:PUA-like domain-containing protein n=1 Tax=Kickxella alabastrina TaxID=61397 RepID=UPI00221F7975|nr:PUA-like domain-containing protein [Kickxella alabastrina]KAI7832076.1 PUA-like domain-containing protein [Kickxella alabastrina]
MDLFAYNVNHGATLVAMLRQPRREPSAVLESEAESLQSAKTLNTTAGGESVAEKAAEMVVDKTDETKEVTAEPAASNNEVPVELKCDQCDNSLDSKCRKCGCFICGGKDDEPHTLACDECGYYYHMRCLTEWGSGKSCAGMSKSCTVVPSNHIGSIPGVRVGQSWSESGVHRPPVGGIAGGSTTPAMSIVLAGGYPEDDDHGEEFYYTGSGGYDLSGNKRQAKTQSFDQELIRGNRSLALSCAAPIDEINGAVATDWKQSSPVRVCRSYKLAKMHPEFAPKEGVRYDGLYRLVKYWREKGVSGFYVWRYFFRRDDSEPAPWTEEGKQNIERLGLFIQSQGQDSPKAAGTAEHTSAQRSSLAEMIRLDNQNIRLWTQIAPTQPCTTPCGHNICAPCLRTSMKKYGIICPMCRCDISSMGSADSVHLHMNQNLVTILKALIPSYGLSWDSKFQVACMQRALRTGITVEK